jgi:hypothetical protein
MYSICALYIFARICYFNTNIISSSIICLLREELEDNKMHVALTHAIENKQVTTLMIDKV